MEAFLTDEWLPEAGAIWLRDEASLTLVRDAVRDVAAAAVVDADVIARAALAATELGRNHLRHAREGRIGVRTLEREGHVGVEIIAADRGKGIVDPTGALEGEPRAHGSLGVGLAAVCENATEVDFDVRLDEGSCVTVRVFPRDTPRRRQIGIYGRALHGERISGDHACVRRAGDVLIAAVCDGLGHGPLAREAAAAAIRVFRAHAGTGPVELLDACHRALGPTRGAVMAVATIDERVLSLETASVGNIAVQLSAPRVTRRFGGSSAVLGAHHALARVKSESADVEARDVLVMTSDGISSRLALEGDLDLMRQHPIVIAHQLLVRFGRDNDDVLVLVAK